MYISTLTNNCYYTGGMLLPGRSFTSNSYRYGFNGKEKTDEVNGTGNSYDFGVRIYDPRVGRWLALDPLANKLPDLSPYNFVANNPLRFTDPDGRFLLDVHQRIATNALKDFSINFKDASNKTLASSNAGKNAQFKFGITGVGTVFSGGITNPDWKQSDNKKAHFDAMNYMAIMVNISRIETETSGLVNGYKSGAITAQKFGEKVGENLHAIQDLYSHSNFVELYAQTYPEQTDISKIPTLKEAFYDPQFAAFAKVLATDLKTGEYDADNPKTGPDSHKGMNHDVGAGSKWTVFIGETRGKKVNWFTRAAEAVATKASKEYLQEVKEKAEK